MFKGFSGEKSGFSGVLAFVAMGVSVGVFALSVGMASSAPARADAFARTLPVSSIPIPGGGIDGPWLRVRGVVQEVSANSLVLMVQGCLFEPERPTPCPAIIRLVGVRNIRQALVVDVDDRIEASDDFRVGMDVRVFVRNTGNINPPPNTTPIFPAYAIRILR